MAANGISRLSTKALKQVGKLNVAQTKRQLTGTPGRVLKYYDLDLLPTKYSDNTIVDNPNPGGLQAGRPWKTTPNILAGLWRSQYNGYFGDAQWAGNHGQQTNSPNWFDTQTPTESIQVTDFSKPDIGESIVSFQWIGYFRAPHTANYIFYITSDDESYFWIGNKAITAYTTANADIWTWSGLGEIASDSIALTAGEYYPIRVQYGNATGQNSFSISWNVELVTNGLTIRLEPSVAAGRSDPNTWTNSVTEFPIWNATSTDFPATVGLISGLTYIEYHSNLPKYWEIANPTTGDFTASIWFSTDSTTGTGTHFYDNPALIGGDSYGVQNDWGIVIANGRVGVGAVSGQTVFTTHQYNDNTWHCATVTRVQTTGVFKIYIDGVFQIQMTEAPGAILTDSDTIRLGADPNNGQPYDGLIGEFDFWQLALSDQDISNNFTVQRVYYGV